MKKTTYLLGALLLSGALTQAQDRKTEKATANFENYAYADAIETYGKLVEDGYNDVQIFKNLGNANYLNANYEKASDWYGKLFNMEDADIEADYLYRYAQTLKSLGDYQGSQNWMQKFEAATESDVRARKFADNPDYLEDIERQSRRYTLRNLSINSTGSDFAPSMHGEQLIFATARDTGTASRKVHKWNNQPFLNLYSALRTGEGEFMNPEKLSKSLNKRTHESSAVVTKDGSTLYFTRNNSVNGRFARDEEEVSRLKIYRASLKEGEWTDIIELPFNGDAFSTAHPALGPDEKKLYFASDREGTFGQSDIFVVDILEDGGFGTPRNLGNDINTEARETFPFVTESNLLYFASDGHPGLGGLDVYATNLKDSDLSTVVNLGKPINGPQDDFSYIIEETTKIGFFASNREGGMGDDDIYGFTENRPLDLNAGASVMASGIDTETDKGTETDADTVTSDTDLSLENKVEEAKEALVLAGTDLIKFLSLEPVYFDLDKANIRPDASRIIMKVVEYMNENPGVNIEIRSHTDAKADADYNERLSERRAENTVAFLIENGISADRVSGTGFGESRLLNECDTQTLCSDARHQENRRSEFIVVE